MFGCVLAAAAATAVSVPVPVVLWVPAAVRAWRVRHASHGGVGGLAEETEAASKVGSKPSSAGRMGQARAANGDSSVGTYVVPGYRGYTYANRDRVVPYD